VHTAPVAGAGELGRLIDGGMPMGDFDLAGDDPWGGAARDLLAKVQTYSVVALFDDAHPATIFEAREV
jgi:hypothetical protein